MAYWCPLKAQDWTIAFPTSGPRKVTTQRKITCSGNQPKIVWYPSGRRFAWISPLTRSKAAATGIFGNRKTTKRWPSLFICHRSICSCKAKSGLTDVELPCYGSGPDRVLSSLSPNSQINKLKDTGDMRFSVPLIDFKMRFRVFLDVTRVGFLELN